jgi:hypothetical protein
VRHCRTAATGQLAPKRLTPGVLQLRERFLAQTRVAKEAAAQEAAAPAAAAHEAAAAAAAAQEVAAAAAAAAAGAAGLPDPSTGLTRPLKGTRLG